MRDEQEERLVIIDVHQDDAYCDDNLIGEVIWKHSLFLAHNPRHKEWYSGDAWLENGRYIGFAYVKVFPPID